MYATLLLMSSTLGGDVTPSQGIVQASHNSGCVGTPAPPCCDSGRKDRVSMLDKIKARQSLRGSGKDCCTPANTCCAPAPAPAPAPVAAPCCDPCAKQRVGMLDKIKARTHSKKSSCCAADPCATVAAPVAPGTTPPKEMPKPKGNEEGASNISPLPIPAPFAAPVSRPTGSSPSGTPY